MHIYHSCLVHCVWCTHRRQPWLTPEIRQRLWPYLGGVARAHGMTALAVGGVADHVHALLSLPSTQSVSKAMQLLKGNASKWLRETFPQLVHCRFGWQEGYGAFSLGVSGVEATRRYIESQEEHHRVRDFAEELRQFLERHSMKLHPAPAD